VIDAGGGLLLSHGSIDELFKLVCRTISDDDGLMEFEACLEAIDGIDAKSMIADDIEMSLVSSKPESKMEEAGK